MAIFSVLGNLFGSKAAGDAIIDGVKSGIDKIWYTEEEKADDAATQRAEVAKARTEGMAVYMEWLRSTSGSRIARRILAFTVAGIWAMEHTAGVVMRVMSTFTNDSGSLTSAKLVEASTYLTNTATENNSLVGVVLLFYFGGPAAIDGVKGLVQKWAGDKK